MSLQIIVNLVFKTKLGALIVKDQTSVAASSSCFIFVYSSTMSLNTIEDSLAVDKNGCSNKSTAFRE